MSLVKQLASRLTAAVEAERVAQGLGHVGPLPREQSVVGVAAEMAVGGGRLINRPLQIERLIIPAGRKSNSSRKVAKSLFSGTMPVSKVSTSSETGSATPIA